VTLAFGCRGRPEELVGGKKTNGGKGCCWRGRNPLVRTRAAGLQEKGRKRPRGGRRRWEGLALKKPCGDLRHPQTEVNKKSEEKHLPRNGGAPYKDDDFKLFPEVPNRKAIVRKEVAFEKRGKRGDS